MRLIAPVASSWAVFKSAFSFRVDTETAAISGFAKTSPSPLTLIEEMIVSGCPFVDKSLEILTPKNITIAIIKSPDKGLR